tara:strand:+ start:1049 stop:1231 length:183 start_codon:yes stop_codon:yes gene_type:complete
MKLLIELPDTADEAEVTEILSLVAIEMATADLTDKEQMDGSYLIETPLGNVFLTPEPCNL